MSDHARSRPPRSVTVGPRAVRSVSHPLAPSHHRYRHATPDRAMHVSVTTLGASAGELNALPAKSSATSKETSQASRADLPGREPEHPTPARSPPPSSEKVDPAATTPTPPRHPADGEAPAPNPTPTTSAPSSTPNTSAESCSARTPTPASNSSRPDPSPAPAPPSSRRRARRHSHAPILPSSSASAPRTSSGS